jgi:hypothetical protein
MQATTEYPSPDQGFVGAERQVRNTSSIYELFLLLQKLGAVFGSDDVHLPENLFPTIVKCLHGAPTRDVTRAHGLRGKVRDLQEKKQGRFMAWLLPKRRPLIDWVILYTGHGIYHQVDRLPRSRRKWAGLLNEQAARRILDPIRADRPPLPDDYEYICALLRQFATLS